MTLTLPQNVALERAILGGLMLDEGAWPDVEQTGLGWRDFYDQRHGRAYSLLAELREKKMASNMLAACHYAQHEDDGGAGYGGLAYLSSLPDHVVTTEGIGREAGLLVDLARRRRLILALVELTDAAQDQTLEVDAVIERCGALAASDGSSRADTWTGAETLAMEAVVAWDARILTARSGGIDGIPTGMPALDGLLNPALPGKVTVVAGRPAMGKSAFALNLALDAAVRGFHVGIVSLEMDKQEVTDRMCVALSRVDGGALLRGELSNDEYSRLTVAADQLSRLPIWIDDQPGQTDADVRRRVRALHRAHGLDYVVVDYMQLMESADEGRNASREAIVSAASRRTKALAREIGVHVVSLSQINRGVESRGDKRPGLGDLRESGAIEQDADRVIFLYRDDYYNQESPDRGLCEAIIAKQRNGQCGTVKVSWSGAVQRFGEWRWRQ